ncbi:radical SAM protein [Aminipila sp.]|uniref:radical SAM protein n=1 Tax=Aminipila sp. TaxID=2060095 RepID=UPI0028A2D642|nr:radical SAM protein [Aminipila sp.]
MKIINCTQAQLLEKIKNNNLKVICFGTGLMAKQALVNEEIAEAVVACVDNDCEKQGKDFLWRGWQYPIIAPNQIERYLTGEDEEKLIVLIASSHFDVISKQLAEIQALNEIELYIYPLLRLNFTTESIEFFETRFVDEAVKEYQSVLEAQNEKLENINNKTEELCQTLRENFKNGKKTAIIPRIMIMPTTRCNMKCKDCSSLLPYFKNPQDLNIDTIIQDLDIFFNAIDRCIRLTVGGEPFLYPELETLLKYLIKQPKLDGILMITNSTLVPKEEVVPLLENSKVFIEISDYGHIEKMSRLVASFEKRRISFKVLSEQFWTDMGNTDFRDKSKEILRYEYLNCDQGRVIKAIFNGKLYICGRSARMHALGAYVSEHDFIELKSTDCKEQTVEKIDRLYFVDYADACNFCDCGHFPTKVIPAGIQLGGNMQQSKYTLVERDEYENLKRLMDIRVSDKL